MRILKGCFALVLLFLLIVAPRVFAQQSTESAINNLKDPDPKIRKEAAADLGVLGKKDAIVSLDEAFRSERDSDVRGQILLSLGRIRDRGALTTLTHALERDPSKDVRLQAIDSLLRLYIPIEDQGVISRFFGGVKSIFAENEQLVVQSFVEVDAAAKEGLSKALRDTESEVRENAAKALGSLRAADQIAAMDEALSISSKDTRVAIVKSLGIMRDDKAGPVLVRHLKDRDEEVIKQAAISLGLVRFVPARDELTNLYRTSGQKDLRRAASEALALIHDPRDKDLFLDLLRDNRDDKLREFGAEGLARIADPSTEQALRDKLNSERKSNVKTALYFALVSLNKTEYLGPLVEGLKARFKNQGEVYLYEVGKHQDRIDLLYVFLNDNEPKIRAGILRVLGRIGNYAAFEKVKPLATDRNEDVAREAVQTMRILERMRN